MQRGTVTADQGLEGTAVPGGCRGRQFPVVDLEVLDQGVANRHRRYRSSRLSISETA